MNTINDNILCSINTLNKIRYDYFSEKIEILNNNIENLINDNTIIKNNIEKNNTLNLNSIICELKCQCDKLFKLLNENINDTLNKPKKPVENITVKKENKSLFSRIFKE